MKGIYMAEYNRKPIEYNKNFQKHKNSTYKSNTSPSIGARRVLSQTNSYVYHYDSEKYKKIKYNCNTFKNNNANYNLSLLKKGRLKVKNAIGSGIKNINEQGLEVIKNAGYSNDLQGESFNKSVDLYKTLRSSSSNGYSFKRKRNNKSSKDNLSKKVFKKGIQEFENANNSDNLQNQAINKSIKYSRKITKTTKKTFNVTRSVVSAIVSFVSSIISFLTIPLVTVIVCICFIVIILGGVFSYILNTVEDFDIKGFNEQQIIAENTSLRRNELINNINNIINDNYPNPYQIIYYKSSNGELYNINNVYENVISEAEINSIIKPVFHMMVLADTDGDIKFDDKMNIVVNDVSLNNETAFTLPTNKFVGAISNRELYRVSNRITNMEKYLNSKYSIGQWKYIPDWTLGDYGKLVYNKIYNSLCTITQEELPTEYCIANGENEDGVPFAEDDCLNSSETKYHTDDDTQMYSCDYYVWKCKGEHEVLICDKEEHTEHTDDCYICGKEEHIHNKKCYDESHNLICGKTFHRHYSSCYVCGKEEHIHDTNNCIHGGVYTCGYTTEHIHTKECYSCETELHTHTEDCYDIIEHEGELNADCGNAEKIKKCRGYELCNGHKVLAISLDYENLDELMQTYILDRIQEYRNNGWSSEANKLEEYYDFFVGFKKE